jgi:hypothetical protein
MVVRLELMGRLELELEVPGLDQELHYSKVLIMVLKVAGVQVPLLGSMCRMVVLMLERVMELQDGE